MHLYAMKQHLYAYMCNTLLTGSGWVLDSFAVVNIKKQLKCFATWLLLTITTLERRSLQQEQFIIYKVHRLACYSSETDKIDEIPQNPLKSLPQTLTYLEKATTNCRKTKNKLKEPSSLNNACVLTSDRVRPLFYTIWF